jgi:hypothetical protein
MSTQTNKIREAGNAMRKQLGRICEIQLADGMVNSAIKSGNACEKWDAALSELEAQPSAPTVDQIMEVVRKEVNDYCSACVDGGRVPLNRTAVLFQIENRLTNLLNP